MHCVTNTTDLWCCAPPCRRKQICKELWGYCVPRKSHCPSGNTSHWMCGGKMCFCCLPREWRNTFRFPVIFGSCWFVPLALCPCLCLYLSLCLCLLLISFSFSLSVSLSLLMSLSFSLSVSLFLSVTLFLSLSLSLYFPLTHNLFKSWNYCIM